MKRNIIIHIASLLILGLLWGLNLLGTYGESGISLGLDIAVFLGSLVLLIWHIYDHRGWMIGKMKQGQIDIVIMLGAILLIEGAFFLKNQFVPTWSYVFGFVLSLLIFSMLVFLMKGKIRFIFLIITLIIFVSYTIGQDVYFRIFREFFSFKEALTLREGIESGESMYRFHGLHLWVVCIGCVALYFLTKYRGHVKRDHIHISSLSHLGLVMILLMVNLNIPHRYETIFSSDYYLYSSVYSKRDFVKHFGLFHLMGRDLVDALIPMVNSKDDEALIEAYVTSIEKAPSVHEHVGQFEGMNLIFILAESYDEIALDPILTPHLYRLKTEGFDFSNHYTPVFQRTTSDTEFIFNTGWIPSIEDGPTVSIFQENTYPESLAHRFSEKGYLTQAFHGNYKEFYGRHIVYEHYGYDAFYGRDELELSALEGRFDARFFEQAKDLIIPETTPFMSFIITFSGHSPYNEHHDVGKENYDIVNDLYPDLDEELKYYLAVQVELDRMVQKLFETLEDKNLLDSTVILLSGDHYPYTMTQSLYEEVSTRDQDEKKYQGNLYIWASQLTPKIIEKQTSSYDILPTLSVLFDLSSSDMDLGHDMFSPLITPVYTKHYGYIMDKKYFSLADASQENYNEHNRIAKHYLLAKMLLRTNYLGTR